MRTRLLTISLLTAMLALLTLGWMETAPKTTDASQSAPASTSSGPSFDNASPTSGSATSNKANAAADAAAYKEVE